MHPATADGGRRMDERVFVNGVNGATGGYLLPPLAPRDISAVARGDPVDEDQLGELRWRHRQHDEATFAPREGVDPMDLAASRVGCRLRPRRRSRGARGARAAPRPPPTPGGGGRRTALPRVRRGRRVPPGRVEAGLPPPARGRSGARRPRCRAVLPPAGRRPRGDPLHVPVPAGRAVRRRPPRPRRSRGPRQLRPQRPAGRGADAEPALRASPCSARRTPTTGRRRSARITWSSRWRRRCPAAATA